MVLLNTRVDVNIILLIGLWHYDAMLRYLHVQDAPVMIFLPLSWSGMEGTPSKPTMRYFDFRFSLNVGLYHASLPCYIWTCVISTLELLHR